MAAQPHTLAVSLVKNGHETPLITLACFSLSDGQVWNA